MKIVKARKDWKCDICGGVIHIGEKYVLEEIRVPEYDNDDLQIGVKFIKHRSHNRKCTNFLQYLPNPKMYLKNCTKGIHKIIWDTNPDSDGEGFCEWCGKIE